MVFFLLTAYFRVPFERLYIMGGRGDLMSLPFTLPRPLFIATPTKFLACFSGFFCIHRSRIGLLGFQKGLGLCGRGLVGGTFVGVTIARFAR